MPSEMLYTGLNIESPKHVGDVGYDLRLSEGLIIGPGDSARGITGVSVELPEGTWGWICGRSSANALGLLVMPAVIDQGYRGELFLLLRNLTAQWLKIDAGTAVGQMIVMPAVTPVLRRVDSLSLSARGTNGFGSTGR